MALLVIIRVIMVVQKYTIYIIDCRGLNSINGDLESWVINSKSGSR